MIDHWIENWLAHQAGPAAASGAILAPGRLVLTYGKLFQQVQAASIMLRQVGIERGRVVGLALPNGPEMGTAFLASLIAGVALPLNPSAPTPEIARSLVDAHASTVIIPAGTDVPARQAANQLGLAVIELETCQNEPAGSFDLVCRGEIRGGPEYQLAEELAMLMFTSGTTGRSKIVPLTVANLQASTRYFLDFACLTPADRELNIMPMFHVQGLLVAFLSTILSGGSIVCTQGFDPAAFFDWYAEFKPTWFSASPTVLQTLANRVGSHDQQISASQLRFIRCSAAPLQQTVRERLERAFKAPVSEAFGMTETGGSITQNPLPPAVRKPGTVGPSIGPELAIMEEGGSQILPRRVVGEIVVRGPSVTRGYLNAPEDNARLFTEGWLHTGDQGILDVDGNLTITGRLKEIILRAGESISPYEVEEVLFQHPSVSSAVVFGVPDPVLGEALATAVVLDQPYPSEQDLQNFVAARLSHSKIPERILFVDAIPKTAVGKIQRIGMAEKLGLSGRTISKISYLAPRTETEEYLAKLWQKVLGLPQVSIDQRFMDLGGDSLLAIRLMAEIKQATGQDLPITALIQHPTIADLADLILGRQQKVNSGVLVQLRLGKPGYPPLIWVGYLYAHTRLSEYLNIPNPVYGLQFDLDGGLIDVSKSFPEMAAGYIHEIQRLYPHGPYLLGGWSLGGFLAYEIACQLQAAGETVLFLGLLDTAATNLPAYTRSLPFPGAFQMTLLQVGADARFHLSQLNKLSWKDRVAYIRNRIGWQQAASVKKMRPDHKLLPVSQESSTGQADLIGRARTAYDLKVKTSLSYRSYLFKRYTGRLTLFKIANPHPAQPDLVTYGWNRLVDGSVDVEIVPGNHDTLVEEPHVRVLAEKISRVISPVESLLR